MHDRHFLRHMLATIAYRGGKAITNAPDGFNNYRLGESTRTPGEILSHIGDVIEWALHLAKGEQVWRTAVPLPWEAEIARFHETLEELDAYLASDAILHAPAGRLLQGPLADALTHIGQIAMMRRLAGSPVRGENYFMADVVVGNVGAAQSVDRVEF